MKAIFHKSWQKNPQIAIYFLIICVLSNVVSAKNWPTYRGDIRRTGASTESIALPLNLHWKYVPLHTPKPAWPLPAEELARMHFDSVYNVAAANGKVYFGSSVTNKLYAIDAANGKVIWTFSAGAK